MNIRLVVALILLNTAFITPAVGQTNASDWFDLSSNFYDQGKYNETILCCDKAIELDPNFAMAWTNKGSALYSLGKLDEAIQAYDEALRLDPTFATAWYNKGIVLALHYFVWVTDSHLS